MDCDGTLIAGDLLFFDLKKLVLKKPWLIAKAILWFFRGKSLLKYRLASMFPLDASTLQYRSEVLRVIHEHRRQNGEVFLATASSEIHASRITEFLGLFQGTFASKPNFNCKARKKAKILVEAFGAKGFDYCGNSLADLPVWRQSDQAFVWTENTALFQKVKKINPTATLVKKGNGQ